MDNPTTSTIEQLWNFSRGELAVSTFEQWVYSAPELEDSLGAERYFELL